MRTVTAWPWRAADFADPLTHGARRECSCGERAAWTIRVHTGAQHHQSRRHEARCDPCLDRLANRTDVDLTVWADATATPPPSVESLLAMILGARTTTLCLYGPACEWSHNWAGDDLEQVSEALRQHLDGQHPGWEHDTLALATIAETQ